MRLRAGNVLDELAGMSAAARKVPDAGDVFRDKIAAWPRFSAQAVLETGA
jgi:hypothetical protein